MPSKETFFDIPVEPDVDELLEVIARRGKGKRAHHVELFLDEAIKEQICERFSLASNIKPDEPFSQQKRDIELHRFLGYDVFRVGLRKSTMFTLPHLAADDTADKRDWAEEHKGPIQSWEDFESYPWPEVSGIDFSAFEWFGKNLPENMGCFELTANILEIVTLLFGYETLCYTIFDDTELVNAVCERVGSFYVEFTKMLCDFSCIRLIWAADDMGYRSGTLFSPEFLRQKILPLHKQCAEIAHKNNRPYLLHSCGNVEAIMDDLIDDVGIDAKHSFEDAIMPVTEAKKRYGNRITLLGGIDVDFLCRADEKATRQRVKETLETCLNETGGYCLGTGNSVASYIPVENYLIMLDQGRQT